MFFLTSSRPPVTALILCSAMLVFGILQPFLVCAAKGIRSLFMLGPSRCSLMRTLTVRHTVHVLPDNIQSTKPFSRLSVHKTSYIQYNQSVHACIIFLKPQLSVCPTAVVWPGLQSLPGAGCVGTCAGTPAGLPPHYPGQTEWHHLWGCFPTYQKIRWDEEIRIFGLSEEYVFRVIRF